MTIALKVLLQHRHLHSHTDFKNEYNKVAASIDKRLVGGAPGKAQYYQWLSGKLNGLPRGQHCRVLEEMFPGWTAERLFAETDPDELLRSLDDGDQVAPASGVQDADLGAFLGEEIASDGVTLVYPTFELAPPAREALQIAGIPRQHYFHKTNSAFATNHRIDVPIALAENDVRALVYISNMLQRDTAVRSEIDNDRNVIAACNRPFISFGLSSNDCTHMYLQRAAQPLFAIEDDESTATPYLEYIRTADGKPFKSTDSTNIGMIIRTRPDPTLHPGRHWFYCAGLGPRGTSGASWFLANNWRALHDQAGTHDFIAVLTVQSYSDQTAQLVHVYADGQEPE